MFPVNVYKIKVTEHEKIKKYLMDNVYPHFEKSGYFLSTLREVTKAFNFIF